MQNAPAACAVALEPFNAQPPNFQAAQRLPCGMPVPPAAAACTARSASNTASGQQRPALAQLNGAGRGSNTLDAGKQLATAGTHATAAPLTDQPDGAVQPQAANGLRGDGAVGGDNGDENDAEEDGGSPAVIDVGTTTGGIQLHRHDATTLETPL